jgi:hypothetical protein
LAIVVTLCCGYLGYFRGYNHGYVLGDAKRKSLKPFSEVYYVADIVLRSRDDSTRMPSVEPLIDLICSTVAPETWDLDGDGDYEQISTSPGSYQLVVTAPQWVHEEIADLLEKLRRFQVATPGSVLMSQVRAVAAGKSFAIVERWATSSKEARQGVEAQFRAGVETITRELTSPSFRGDSTAKNFPDWVTGRSAAIWETPQGQLYLVLQTILPKGEVLIIGCRDKDSPPMEWITLPIKTVNLGP